MFGFRWLFGEFESVRGRMSAASLTALIYRDHHSEYLDTGMIGKNLTSSPTLVPVATAQVQVLVFQTGGWSWGSLSNLGGASARSPSTSWTSRTQNDVEQDMSPSSKQTNEKKQLKKFTDLKYISISRLGQPLHIASQSPQTDCDGSCARA